MNGLTQKAKVLVGIFFCASIVGFLGISNNAAIAEFFSSDQKEIMLFKQATFGNLSFESKSVYVYDVSSKEELFSFAPEKVESIASLTKILTAVISFRELKEDTLVTIPKTPYQEIEGGELILKEIPATTWKSGDLIKMMLVSSSNEAAVALSEKVNEEKNSTNYFLLEMNKRVRSLGLHYTHFKNVTGLDKADGSLGAMSTAKEVASFVLYAKKLYPSLFLETKNESIDFILPSGENIEAVNTNKLVSEIPHLKLSKTGYTTLGGGSLAVVYLSPVNGHEIVTVVLSSSKEGRFSDMGKIIKATNDYLSLIQK